MLKNKSGLKKNLFRVKQLADQGLGRAEKTEVLSEDLQNAEKKVENLKTVLQNMHKKLAVLLQAHNIGDQEKRLKKMPAYQLAQSFDENRLPIGDGMLSDVFEQCSKGLKSMGEAQVTYELIVERESLAYFQQLLDEDIPAIKKSRNYLKQLTLDMDATRSRLTRSLERSIRNHIPDLYRQQSANKDSSHHPTSNNQMRSETLANELEDAEKRVAECKDRYATEMLTFISKESEICQRIAEWMDAQAQYHRSCLTHVEDMLPDMKCIIEQHSTRPVYGCPLDEHLQSSGREIALVIEACVSILYHDGLEEEGLFRIAGGAAKLKKLKAAFNVGTMADMEEYYSDLHVVAGALKLYIRELPEPLLTFGLFEEFVSCLSIQDRDSRLKKMWLTVNKLPKTNFNNVKYLIKFLAKLAEKSDINKMTNSNIAIVFGPNLIYSINQDNAETNVAFSGIQNQVVEILVENHEYLFPGDVDFELHENVGLATDSYNTSSSSRENSLGSLTQHDPLSGRLSGGRVNYPSSDSDKAFYSWNSNGQMTSSTDTLNNMTDSASLRKKNKGNKLSLPAALNNAGDKLFGKRKSGESFRNKSSTSDKPEKKERKKLKHLFSIRRSNSKDKLQTLSRSVESGLNESGSLSDSVDQSDDYKINTSGCSEVVFKPRYTPLSEKQQDCWRTGAPDAPLADAEGDSPLFVETPVRAFPLSNTPIPHFVHSDMYDTAFALASLKSGEGSITGLNYLNKVRAVVDEAYKASNNNNNNGVCKKVEIDNKLTVEEARDAEIIQSSDRKQDMDIKQLSSLSPTEEVQFADVETFIGPTTSTPSPQAKNTMFGRRPSATPSATSALLELASNHSATKVKHQVHNDVTAAASNTSSNNSMSASTHLSTSQHSLASTDSSSASPSTLRRNKKQKPAPPPPPTTSPHQKLPVQQQESAPANKPNIPVRPEQPITRHESIKKPTIPPPGPPKSSRPNNPPPPTPSGPAPSLPGQTTIAVTDSQVNSDLEPIPSSNPFNTDEVNISDRKEMVSFSRAKSDSSSPDRETDTLGVEFKKTHTRNASADLTQSPTLKHEPKGHVRARSHDYRMKQPPPVPQRTHSMLTNHSSDLGARTKNILLTQSTDDSVSTSFSTAYNNETAATASDSGRASAGSSVSTNPFEDVIVENATESTEDDEKRDRMNSQTDFTLL